MPANEYFNAHTKRARMPTPSRMESATLRLARTYELYMDSPVLGRALRSDLGERFVLSPIGELGEIARAVAGATLAIADARSVDRF